MTLWKIELLKVAPATNFTAAFPNIGYRGIRKIFDDNKINYMRKTIIQASHLKETFESIDINEEDCTIMSLDIEAFYPSVHLSVVKKAINYFGKDLDSYNKNIINKCISMIEFGMGNTLITFIDKYYEYDGDQEINDKGLTIGGYELGSTMQHLPDPLVPTTALELLPRRITVVHQAQAPAVA